MSCYHRRTHPLVASAAPPPPSTWAGKCVAFPAWAGCHHRGGRGSFSASGGGGPGGQGKRVGKKQRGVSNSRALHCIVLLAAESLTLSRLATAMYSRGRVEAIAGAEPVTHAADYRDVSMATSCSCSSRTMHSYRHCHRHRHRHHRRRRRRWERIACGVCVSAFFLLLSPQLQHTRKEGGNALTGPSRPLFAITSLSLDRRPDRSAGRRLHPSQPHGSGGRRFSTRADKRAVGWTSGAGVFPVVIFDDNVRGAASVPLWTAEGQRWRSRLACLLLQPSGIVIGSGCASLRLPALRLVCSLRCRKSYVRSFVWEGGRQAGKDAAARLGSARLSSLSSDEYIPASRRQVVVCVYMYVCIYVFSKLAPRPSVVWRRRLVLYSGQERAGGGGRKKEQDGPPSLLASCSPPARLLLALLPAGGSLCLEQQEEDDEERKRMRHLPSLPPAPRGRKGREHGAEETRRKKGGRALQARRKEERKKGRMKE